MRVTSPKLSLIDAISMALGVIVGGGFFAVLGQTTETAGNAAFISVGLAGLLALITGISYTRLTLHFNEPGGSFVYISPLVGTEVAGTLSWFLILGYLFTTALYASTFGAFATLLLDVSWQYAPFLGAMVVILLAAVNLAGIRISSFFENLLIYSNIGLLLFLAGKSSQTMRLEEALPILEVPPKEIIFAAAQMFVGFEGFQLLTYNYHDIANHKRNFPRAMRTAILLSISLYVLLAFVTTAAVNHKVAGEQPQTILIDLANLVLGQQGLALALVIITLSMTAAINATMFSHGRLAKHLALKKEIPPELTQRQYSGVPLLYLAFIVAVVIGILFTIDLDELAAFSSLVLLFTFAIVNLAAAIHSVYPGWQLIFPLLGCAGCIIATATLINQLLLDNLQDFWKMSGAAAILLILRLVYLYWRRAKLPLPLSVWKQTPAEAQILIMAQLRRLGELEAKVKELESRLNRNSKEDSD